MGKISKDTLMPISLVIALLALAGWLTTIKANGDNLEKRVISVEVRQSKDSEVMNAIDERLSRIEGKLDQELEQ